MVRPPSPSNSTVKFLCSYGGKILPRLPDGKLRYHGGHTRVLSVRRSISFSELMMKMTELCNASVTLRCQLPTEDLDALISIKSDEDLANLMEEYDRMTSSSLKIRAFLFPMRPTKIPSPPVSEYVSLPSPKSPSPKSLSPSSSFSGAGSSPRFVPVPVQVAAYPICYGKSGGGAKVAQPQSHYGCHHCHRNPSHIYLIHSGNHWQ